MSEGTKRGTPSDIPVTPEVPPDWVWCGSCESYYPPRHAKVAHPQPGLFGWRDWPLTHRAVSRMYVLGIISASAVAGCYETRHGWRLTWVHWRGKRPYILGIKRERWGHPWHRIRRGHWPDVVFLGMCGICCPWPCCGATGLDHAEGCPDE